MVPNKGGRLRRTYLSPSLLSVISTCSVCRFGPERKLCVRQEHVDTESQPGSVIHPSLVSPP